MRAWVLILSAVAAFPAGCAAAAPPQEPPPAPEQHPNVTLTLELDWDPEPTPQRLSPEVPVVLFRFRNNGPRPVRLVGPSVNCWQSDISRVGSYFLEVTRDGKRVSPGWNQPTFLPSLSSSHLVVLEPNEEHVAVWRNPLWLPAFHELDDPGRFRIRAVYDCDPTRRDPSFGVQSPDGFGTVTTPAVRRLIRSADRLVLRSEVIEFTR